MKATTITPDLIQLTRLRVVNAYLVREDDGLTLVDTTTGGAAGALVAAARAAGGEIRRVALTHGHGDHVGSLDALRDELGTDVPVLMPELDARIHAGEHVVDGKLPGSWPTLRTVPDVRLAGGDRVGSLEVVPAPGHTPGHVAFLDTRSGALLAGDVFTTYGRVEVSNHFYWRFPLAAMATWDGSRDAATARALHELGPTVLAPGHGPAVRDPGTQIAAALARA